MITKEDINNFFIPLCKVKYELNPESKKINYQGMRVCLRYELPLASGSETFCDVMVVFTDQAGKSLPIKKELRETGVAEVYLINSQDIKKHLKYVSTTKKCSLVRLMEDVAYCEILYVHERINEFQLTLPNAG